MGEPEPEPRRRGFHGPLQPAAIIGREPEVEAACRTLVEDGVRLLTLTGPAGTGKTRLAVAVGAALENLYPDGVWFVDLAPVAEAASVIPAVAETLDVSDAGGRPAAAAVQGFLAGRRLLLVLDNFEHVLAAAPQVADLLAAGPNLSILVTSRAPLHLRWEHELPVPPLEVPDLRRLPPLSELAQIPAVALFVQRARATRRDFRLDEANAAAVAEICVRLDGLPLAIELAAARAKLLPPPALLARLQRRLHLLVGGARDQPTRHQTLRAALAWSYDLLSPAERALFRRLGVFAGGFSLEAAEVVCADGNAGGTADGTAGGADERPTRDDESAAFVLCRGDILDGLASLVDNSLVRQQDGPEGEPRFSLLETVREFALDRLAASGETETVSGRHAACYLALALQAEGHLRRGASLPWLARLDAEYDNLRAVLERSLAPALGEDTGAPDDTGVAASARGSVGRGAVGCASTSAAGTSAELALRLAAHISRYWGARYRFAEGRRWLAAALAAAPDAPPDVRARALFETGRLAESHGDHTQALRAYEASLTLYRALGDRWGTAEALALTGAAHGRVTGDYRRRAALLEEALGLFHELGDAGYTSWVASILGRTLYDLGDVERAVALLEEGLAQSRTIGSGRGASTALMALGTIARRSGDYQRAQDLLDECEAVMSAVGGRAGLVLVQADRGLLAQAQGDLRRAAACFHESLTLAHANGNDEQMAAVFFRLGALTRECGDERRAARLFGAARARLDIAGLSAGAIFRGYHEPDAGALALLLEGSACRTEFETGRAWPLDVAMAEALVTAEAVPAAAAPPAGETGPAPPTAPPVPPFDLTPREVEVLRLLAEGASDAEIARQLVISVRTANAHVARILGKTGSPNRAAAAVLAQRHGLI